MLLHFFSLSFLHVSRVNDENRFMGTPELSGSAKSARKMFGSIERGLDRVRLMLTPRRRQLQRQGGFDTDASSNGGPNVVPNKVQYTFLNFFQVERHSGRLRHTLMNAAFTYPRASAD